ncbi:MAG: hypothetical protein AAB436_00780 [Patescibacteria group bacterium]
MAQTKKASSDKMVGYMMYAVAVGMPLTNIPQLNQIYSTKVTTGLSVTTWIMYLIFGFIPLLYAISNKLRPLIISNILWMVVYALMIYGILIYTPNLVPHDYNRLLAINNFGKMLTQIGLFFLSVAFALFSYDLIELTKDSRRGKQKA